MSNPEIAKGSSQGLYLQNAVSHSDSVLHEIDIDKSFMARDDCLSINFDETLI